MSTSLLPQRPRGVRKHWKRQDLVPADKAFEFVLGPFVPEIWGAPIETVRFSYRSITKRNELAYADGRRASISFGFRKRVIRLFRA